MVLDIAILFFALVVLMSELTQGLAINDAFLRATRTSGRQRRAISALEADIKRYGTRMNRDRGVSGDSTE